MGSPLIFLQDQTASSLPQLMRVLGDLSWLIVYILVLRRGFLDRSYGVPAVSICLNLGWEFYFGVVCPANCPTPPDSGLCDALCNPSQPFNLYTVRLWLLINIGIFIELLRYGRKYVTFPLLRRFFYPVVAMGLVFAYLLESNFVAYFKDSNGTILAWIINLVMSVLFCTLPFHRPNLHGISYGAAWFKLFGNLFLAIGLASSGLFEYKLCSGGIFGNCFPGYLYGITVVFDVLYVAMLTKLRMQGKVADAGAAAGGGIAAEETL